VQALSKIVTKDIIGNFYIVGSNCQHQNITFATAKCQDAAAQIVARVGPDEHIGI